METGLMARCVALAWKRLPDNVQLQGPRSTHTWSRDDAFLIITPSASPGLSVANRFSVAIASCPPQPEGSGPLAGMSAALALNHQIPTLRGVEVRRPSGTTALRGPMRELEAGATSALTLDEPTPGGASDWLRDTPSCVRSKLRPNTSVSEI